MPSARLPDRRRNVAALLALALLAFAPSAAQALQEPRAIATDSRIRTLRFSPNEVYQFVGHYGYQSTIEFAEDEKIQTVSIGDSLAWMVNPSGNRLFLKPIEQNALTNMTIITDKNSYLFELHAEETTDIRSADMVFVLRFIYPQSDGNTLDYSQYEALPDLERDAEKYNFNYQIRGSSVIEPIRIFDDGNFTYFEFRDLNAEVPAFFHVDGAGNEQLINFRKRGNYIVVERVSSRFTLRRGPEIMCVYNERIPFVPTQEPQKPNSQKVREFKLF